MKNNILILTSNVGNKDNLKDQINIFPNCDYIALVDSHQNVNSWVQHQSFNFSNIDQFQNRRNSKLYKILSSWIFNQYEYIVWLDATQHLKFNPQELIDKHDEFDYLLFKHGERNCLYDELNTVNLLHLDNSDVLNQQYEYYKYQGMPYNYGLYEMGFHIKKVNKNTMNLDLMWFEQVNKFSSRDQCSFPFCLWKMNDEIKIKYVGEYENNPHRRQSYVIEQKHNY